MSRHSCVANIGLTFSNEFSIYNNEFVCLIILNCLYITDMQDKQNIINNIEFKLCMET